MHPGTFLALSGLMFAIGGFWLGRSMTSGRSWWRDALSLLALVPVALFSVRPYLGSDLVGAGDSEHYALQVADFVTQARQGVMPILVGQSEYAFNGNIHTLRTAPYFTHLAGLIDWATLHTRSFVSLQNLTVAVTAVLTAWAAYAGCCYVSGRRRVLSVLLASLYVLSPAIAGPLPLLDMFATYMAVPWLILCWAGIAGLLRSDDRLTAQVLAAGALGMMWYAHPPLAAWMSMVWGLVQLWLLLREGGSRSHWRDQMVAVLVLAGISAYFAASLATLGPGRQLNASPEAFAYTAERLREYLRSEFAPFRANPDLVGLQLGWSLWLALAAATFLAWQRRFWAALALAVIIAALLPFLWPVPGVTGWWWQALPQRLIDQTNWPAQRLCPLLAGGIIVMVASVGRGLGPRLSTAIAVGLSIAAGWSAAELAALHARGSLSRRDASYQAIALAPANVRLTRYSYALFEQTPAYFSHGWMDPEFESRLFDAKLYPLTNNAKAAVDSATAGPMIQIVGQVTLKLESPGLHVLEFAFVSSDLVGEVTVQGPGIRHAYSLPTSGGPLAFGCGPQAVKAVPVRLSTPGANTITVSATVAGVSVRAVKVNRAALPIHLVSLVPYTAEVRMTAPGYLETPRMYLDGYTAIVNGKAVSPRRSVEGLVTVPVPAGNSVITVGYQGPRALRGTWFLTVAAVAAWPWLLAGSRNRQASSQTARSRTLLAGVSAMWISRRKGIIMVTAMLGIAGVTGWIGYRWHEARQTHQSLRLLLEFPLRHPHRAEPLVTFGVTGAADCIYVIYDDDEHIRIGYDHWSLGGPVSGQFALKRGQTQRLEISGGGLDRKFHWWGWLSTPKDRPAYHGPLRVTLDGETVLAQELPYYSFTPREVRIGSNHTGSSVVVERFSGRILDVQRF